MGTLFASTLRALVREKSLFIWSLAFPILMATIFVTALVAGRMRATSDDAGGNAAAAVPR